MVILILVYILNVIDYYETIFLAQHIGIEYEINPIMRFCFENDYMAMAKLIGVAILMIIYAIVYRIGKDRKNMWGGYVLLVAYSVIVLNNLYLIWYAGLLPQFLNFL